MKLKEINQKYTVKLASQSPRRQQFLRDLGVDFQLVKIDIEENYPSHLQKEEITDFLCQLKAEHADFTNENDVIITCDTIVWHDGKALGKPKNADEAFEIISSMSGKTHTVVSSVCMKSKEKTVVFHESTEVSFSQLTDEDIRYYIETYRPFDKAGAYGIQEWIGLIGIEKINGSYTNVVGMPMEKLYKHLINWDK